MRFRGVVLACVFGFGAGFRPPWLGRAGAAPHHRGAAGVWATAANDERASAGPALKRAAAAAAETLGRRVDAATDTLVARTRGLSPLRQLGAVLAMYAVHAFWLSRHAVPLPFQLIPNDRGLFQAVGLDSLAGAAVFAARARRTATMARRRGKKRDRRRRAAASVTALYGPPPRSEAAARLPKRLGGGSLPRRLVASRVSTPAWRRRVRTTSLLLAAGYAASGVIASARIAARLDAAPLSDAMRRSCIVLLSHLSWVACGAAILGAGAGTFWRRRGNEWYVVAWQKPFCLWVAGGYYVSALAFNVADAVNTLVLPKHLLSSDGVVAQLLNPDGNTLAALGVGAIAPCLIAPWWEEFLYRGYLLPALAQLLPPKERPRNAVVASALVFSLSHLQPAAALPLFVLGYAWALLYVASGNLLVTALIHALWNTRVFLGALLGL